jgi:hypothetical protein
MPHPENRCSTLLITGYKRLAEGGREAFAFGFLMGKVLEGKRIDEGKRIAERKKIAEGKMNC